MTERVRPFSNGSEYGAWAEHNCTRCKRFVWEDIDATCIIDRALWRARDGDGTVSATIARRAGYDGAWPVECKEREA